MYIHDEMWWQVLVERGGGSLKMSHHALWRASFSCLFLAGLTPPPHPPLAKRGKKGAASPALGPPPRRVKDTRKEEAPPTADG